MSKDSQKCELGKLFAQQLQGEIATLSSIAKQILRHRKCFGFSLGCKM